MDRRTFIKGATVAVGGFTLLGAQGCEPGPIAGEGYRQVFNDEFDTLDTNIWGPTPAHRDTIPPGAFTVADSILTVRADLSRPRPYEELTTLGPFSSTVPHYPQATAWQEGYFEIRARCTNNPWSKLALWFFSLEAPNYANATRPCAHLNSEWDMVENGVRLAFAGPDTGRADVNSVSVLHRNTSSPCNLPDETRSLVRDFPGGGLCDWHVWSGKWTSTELSTYLDGQLLGTQTPYDTTAQPMYLEISAAPAASLTSPPPGMPDPPAFIETQVDWVRVWQK